MLKTLPILAGDIRNADGPVGPHFVLAGELVELVDRSSQVLDSAWLRFDDHPEF